MAVSQVFALWTLDAEFPLASVVAYAPPVFAVYGGVLALFFAWRVHDRPDGRAAGLWLSLFALNLAVSIVPSQAPSFAQVAVYSISMVHIVVALRFAMVFPREITVPDLRGLRRDGDGPARRLRPGNTVLRLQELIVSHRYVLWVLAAVLAGLWYVRNRYGTVSYYLAISSSARSAVVKWVALAATTPLSLAVVFLGLAFLYSGYRLSDTKERQRILWIVLSFLFTALFAAVVFSLIYLGILTDLAILRTMSRSIIWLLVPSTSFALLTGFAVAVLYSGAFDVRPLISRTTVYGTLGILAIILFASVESLVSEVIEARLGLPDIVGGAVSGGIVAAIILPLRGRFSRGVNRLLASTENRSEDLHTDTVG